jgi:hypothetical protein
VQILDLTVGLAVFAGPVLDQTAGAVGDFGEGSVSLGGGHVVVGRVGLFGEVHCIGVDSQICSAQKHA